MGILSKHLSQARFARILPHVRGDVLDIGCQRGTLYEYAGDRIDRYVGIDMDERTVLEARQRHPEHRFFVTNLDDGVPEFEERFDVIVMAAVIEHVFNLKSVFDGLAAALKPNGRIVLTTPTVIGNDLVHRLGASVGLFSQDAQDDHIVIFNKRRFEVLANEVGLDLERHSLFQLGCNQLAILRAPAAPAPSEQMLEATT